MGFKVLTTLYSEYLSLKSRFLALSIVSLVAYTGRERLIRSHSSARFCFELSGNSN